MKPRKELEKAIDMMAKAKLDGGEPEQSVRDHLIRYLMFHGERKETAERMAKEAILAHTTPMIW